MDLTVENTTDYEPVHNVAGNGVVGAKQYGSINVKGNVRIGFRFCFRQTGTQGVLAPALPHAHAHLRATVTLDLPF